MFSLKKYPKKSGEFRVVYAGNLGKMQNVELVLEAAALMKDEPAVSFYIVGSGVNEEQLKAFAKRKKLTNVNLLVCSRLKKLRISMQQLMSM